MTQALSHVVELARPHIEREYVRRLARIIGARRLALAKITRENTAAGRPDTTFNDGQRAALRDLARTLFPPRNGTTNRAERDRLSEAKARRGSAAALSNSTKNTKL